MRWFFLFLLVVNIVYVGWESGASPSFESSVPAMLEGVPTISLLSELGKASRVAGGIDENAAAKETVVASINKGDKPENEKQKTMAKKDQCYTLGPFRELIDLRDFTRAIKTYVKSASFRSRDEKEQSTFRVFLKPTSSAQEATVLSKRLMDLKVKDHYIIKTGPEANAISLGHFTEKNRAYTHSASIGKLGFSPVVEPVFKDYTLYWLDYRVVPDKNVPAKVFERHLSKKINHLQRKCS